jgi:Xaa-Pro dipeptidase
MIRYNNKGHSLGLDVHDSLQLLRTEYLDLPASSKEYPHLFKYLRIRRTLEKDMVLTIEPGCYFSLSLMDEYKVRESKHVDSGTLYRYIPVGGVRIEDVVVVREEGCENLTEVGREVDWIEKACGGGA